VLVSEEFGQIMIDATKWKVRGPVATLTTEYSTWDIAAEEWQPARNVVATTFRPDGAAIAADYHNPDGSIAHSQWVYDDAGRLLESRFQLGGGRIDRTVYSYDEAGRHVRTVQVSHDGTQTETEICTYDFGGKKTKVRFLGHLGACNGFRVEGSEQSYPAPGTTAMITTYDEQHLPTRTVFEDINHKVVTTVILTRDASGRLVKEEMAMDQEAMLTSLFQGVPPDQREEAAAVFKDALGKFSSYTYDDQGRRTERTLRMGRLSENRSTYLYQDRDDPIEETTEHRNREARINENGTVDYAADHVTVQHNRFEYLYDAHGNWTERTVSYQVEPNPDFQRSNIERRAITYHPA
jgi:YD repeat-containing protein